jgi:stage II sporulation protein AA (anti-sigma F factor antagonist)
MNVEDVIFHIENQTLVAKIMCEIDHHSAKRIREAIDSELFEKKPKALEINFSSVRFMDSSGIALILGRVESAGAVGASVHLCGLSPLHQKLVSLSGIEKIRGITISHRG